MPRRRHTSITWRTSAPVEDENVSYHPGDTFAVGPKVTKAAPTPAVLQREWQALQRGGYDRVCTEGPVYRAADIDWTALPSHLSYAVVA